MNINAETYGSNARCFQHNNRWSVNGAMLDLYGAGCYTVSLYPNILSGKAIVTMATLFEPNTLYKTNGSKMWLSLVDFIKKHAATSPGSKIEFYTYSIRVMKMEQF